MWVVVALLQDAQTFILFQYSFCWTYSSACSSGQIEPVALYCLLRCICRCRLLTVVLIAFSLITQSACQQELDKVLEEIAKMTSEDNRGPLENLYELKFPNCDRHGLYNLKQVSYCTGRANTIIKPQKAPSTAHVCAKRFL